MPLRSHGPRWLHCLSATLSELIMSKQHWHEGSRVDYITSLALARSHAESHGRLFPSHTHPFHRHDNTHPSPHMPKRLQLSAIPDLRFEQTYLAKIEAADPSWHSIAWITIRDYAISPLLQGALWCVPFKAFTIVYLVTCKPFQGHRVRACKAIAATPYMVVVSARRFAASERGQHRRLAPPMGPLALSPRKVGELVRDTMMDVKLRARGLRCIWYENNVGVIVRG